MPVPVIMPKFEMSQETGQIISWYKKEGDAVKKGEAIFSVETDKVTMDVESPGDGILAGVTAKEGESVPVTTVIAYLLGAGESLPAGGAPAAAAPQPAPAAAAAEAPKAPVSAPASATPVAQRMAAANALDLSAVQGSGPKQTITKADVESALARRGEEGKVRATPAARRVAREGGVDLDTVVGSGPRGRVQESDVQDFLSAAPQAAAPAQPQAIAQASSADFDTIPLKGMRRTIADRMVASYQSAPHIMFTMSIDVSSLEGLRKRMNEQAAKRGEEKISMTALLARAVAWALLRHSRLNSTLTGDEIRQYKTANIGIAVALEDGLIVPVVRNVEKKGVAQLAAEINDLAKRARESRLTPSDVTGGTFTISNLGPFGIEQFTAILNAGQAGILAVGAVQKEVVVVNDEMVIRPIMRMTLSADHRTVDGAVAAQFMADLRSVMENPDLLLY